MSLTYPTPDDVECPSQSIWNSAMSSLLQYGKELSPILLVVVIVVVVDMSTRGTVVFDEIPVGGGE